MKKLISTVLSLIMILGVCTNVQLEAFASQSNFLFLEDYDRYATNAELTGCEFSAETAYIVASGESNKQAFLEGSGRLSVSYPVKASLDGNFFSFDVIMPDNLSSGALTVKAGGKDFEAVKVTSERNLTTYDGRKIGAAPVGKLIKVALTFNKKHSRYSIYINGKAVMTDWYLQSGYPSGEVTAIGVTALVNEKSTLIIDKLGVYTSEKLIKSEDFPAVNFNTSVMEDKRDDFSHVTNNSEEPMMLFSYNFNGTVSHGLLQMYPYENSITQEFEKDGNGYMHLVRSNSTDCFIMSQLRDQTIVTAQMNIKAPSSSFSFMALDKDNKRATVLTCNADGELTGMGKKLGTLSKRDWTNLTLSINAPKNSISYWINGKPAALDVSLGNAGFGIMASLRMIASSGEMMIDNYVLYSGTGYVNYSSVFSGIADESAVLYNAIIGKNLAEAVFAEFDAVHEDVGSIYASGVKIKGLKNPYYDGEKLMISSEAALALGFDADGAEYVSLSDAASKAGKTVTEFDTGLFLIGNREVKLGKENLLLANANVIYDRPTAEELKPIDSSVHPKYLLTPEKVQKIKNAYGKDEYVTKWADEIIAKADLDLNLPPYDYNKADGLRLLPVAGQIDTRINKLALAYIIKGDKKYADRVWQEMEHTYSYPDWGQGIHYLDVAAMATAILKGYDWLYECWTPEQKKMTEDALWRYFLDYSYDVYHLMKSQDYGWATTGNNWNPTCNGGVACVASILYDTNPAKCGDLIENALRLMESAMKGFYPAGAWIEGTHYWGSTVSDMSDAAITLKNVFGTDFGITLSPAFDKTAEYTMNLCGPGGSNNYNDNGGGVKYSNPYTFYLSSRFSNPSWARIRLYDMKVNKTAGSVEDIIYYLDCDMESAYTFPRDSYLKGDEAVSLRADFEDNYGAFISMHSGGNWDAEWHSHIDAGTFVLDMLGERFVYDMGSQDYNSDGMNSHDLPTGNKITRWSYYQLAPEGHNCLIINPSLENIGQNIYSKDKITHYETNDKGAYAITELSDAYAGFAESVRRGIKLDDDRRSVVVRDEIKFSESSNEVWWIMHTSAATDVEVVDGSTLILTKNGKKVKMMLSTDAQSSEWVISGAGPKHILKAAPPQQYTLLNYRKVAAKLKGSGSMNITVKFIPFDDPAAEKPVDTTSLDDWKLPEGEFVALPKPSMIKVGGENVEDFDVNTKFYSVKIPFGATEVPEVSAVCDENSYAEITQNTSDIESVAAIKVISKQDQSVYNTYYVGYEIDMATIEQYRIEPAGVEVSEEPQPENHKGFAIDGNLSTRWSAEGVGQWITLDYGKSVPIDYIGAAFMNGTARVTKYKLYISNDNETWELIYDGGSSGLTNDIELSPYIGKSARYIRLEGFGNSVNMWNSVTEFAAYKF